MSQFLAWLSHIFQSWKFWIVIPPWDIGVRVRLGQLAASMAPGLHLRIPFIDEITLVNTRRRLTSMPSVALPGSSPSKVRSVAATVAFAIADPLKAMLAYTMPDNMISSLAQAQLATSGMNLEACLEALRREFGPNGIEIESIYFVENVEVRTIKLLQGGGGLWSGNSIAPAGPNPVASY